MGTIAKLQQRSIQHVVAIQAIGNRLSDPKHGISMTPPDAGLTISFTSIHLYLMTYTRQSFRFSYARLFKTAPGIGHG